MKRIKLLVVLIQVLFLLSCSKEPEKLILSINGRYLEVEVARTEKEREKGLMNRKSLGWNEGMLFIFDDDQYLSFWMKNTSIPLSIAFLDKNGIVTDIYSMKPFSLEPVVSSRKCRYAIEVNDGFFEECVLKIGDRIEINIQ